MNNSLPLFAHFYPPHIKANSIFDNLLKNVTKMKQSMPCPIPFLGTELQNNNFNLRALNHKGILPCNNTNTHTQN